VWVVVQGVLRSGEGWSVRWSRRSPSPACSALAAPWQRVGSPPCLVRCRSATHSSARRPRTALGIAAWTCAARRGSRCAPPAPGGSPTPGCSPAEGSSWCSTPQGYARRTSRCRPRSGSGSRSGRVRRWGGWQSAIRDALAPACTGGCCAARPTSTRCRCWGPRMRACFPPERWSPAKDRPTLAARDRCGTRRRSSAESPARYRVGRLSASGRPPHRDSRCARPIGPGAGCPCRPRGRAGPVGPARTTSSASCATTTTAQAAGTGRSGLAPTHSGTSTGPGAGRSGARASPAEGRLSPAEAPRTLPRPSPGGDRAHVG